jgi:2,3-bisphosphoglycerate-independent phosphoglycerate mutase
VVDVLVILDGASEPMRAAGTALEGARTPVLDALGREGAVSRLRTVAPGLPAGSEAAIPALLGWVPPAHAVHRIGGHRLLLVGPPPLPPSAHARLLHTWPEGLVPPRLLDADVVVIAARGAAAGCARLLGASVVNPPSATGAPDTDLHAKAAAALAAIADRARRVVVHVGAPDEAAHQRDAAGKVAVIERIDRELIAPVAQAVARAGGSLAICPDHGCDPATGEHDDEPVPHLRWPDPNGPAGRLTERAVAGLPVAELHLAAVA